MNTDQRPAADLSLSMFSDSSDEELVDWFFSKILVDKDQVVSSKRSVSKKQLPKIPAEEAYSSTSTRMKERQQSLTAANGSYGPYFLEYSLLAEYNQLQKNKLPGVYVIPSAGSPLHWFGVLFVRQGMYQEGVFKFDLFIPDNYPDGECPRLVFKTPIFHPVIDIMTGELDVKRAFPKWKRSVNHIWQILLYARRIFYKIDTKSPLNPEAAALYDNDQELFKGKVSESVQLCKSKMYDVPDTDDPHAIHFSQLSEDAHEKAKHAICEAKPPIDEQGMKNAQSSGLSWVKPGTTQVFSRDCH
ncbi:AKT-interacting protein-like isoform X2 [Anneissia japonica]|uniref:AKT-interacting protein-like isoform X2 n=1 Tax=Anneissia japonica TaxID=1529436 RepID=UPI001425A26E|nr:AKT-interacting protein-like isoform X2 [Anneissia japonica]